MPSSSTSTLGLEHVDAATLDAMRPIMNVLSQRGAPWRCSLEDPAGWLRPLGWEAEVLDHEQAGARLGRSLSHPPPSASPGPKAWLASAVRT